MLIRVTKIVSLIIVTFYLAACTTINVDHVRLDDDYQVQQGDSVVILSRKNTAEVETERTLISCLGKKLNSKVKQVNVISEQQFVDRFFPWFEPRTAPQNIQRMQTLLNTPLLKRQINALGIRYLVWLEGSTETTNSSGSMSCAITPGGGGCFGFGAWEDTSDYEASIWEIEQFKEIGRISTEAVGTSYMPAFVVPIPMLARVELDVCKGMGKQLVDFFASNTGSE